MYTQCLLTKNDKQQTAWIPNKFAILDKVIKLKRSNNIWDNGWIVKTVYETTNLDNIEQNREAMKHMKIVAGLD